MASIAVKGMAEGLGKGLQQVGGILMQGKIEEERLKMAERMQAARDEKQRAHEVERDNVNHTRQVARDDTLNTRQVALNETEYTRAVGRDDKKWGRDQEQAKTQQGYEIERLRLQANLTRATNAANRTTYQDIKGEDGKTVIGQRGSDGKLDHFKPSTEMTAQMKLMNDESNRLSADYKAMIQTRPYAETDEQRAEIDNQLNYLAEQRNKLRGAMGTNLPDAPTEADPAEVAKLVAAIPPGMEAQALAEAGKRIAPEMTYALSVALTDRMKANGSGEATLQPIPGEAPLQPIPGEVATQGTQQASAPASAQQAPAPAPESPSELWPAGQKKVDVMRGKFGGKRVFSTEWIGDPDTFEANLREAATEINRVAAAGTIGPMEIPRGRNSAPGTPGPQAGRRELQFWKARYGDYIQYAPPEIQAQMKAIGLY